MSMVYRGPSLGRLCVSELTGVFILVFFGVGSVQTAVLCGAQTGIWQVGVVWGVAVSLAIYSTGSLSGCHINPAITLAFVVHRGFPARRACLYVLAQLAGAVLAAVVLYGLFGDLLAHFEETSRLVRGAPGSELSAMVFGEYFPNPITARTLGWAPSVVSPIRAMAAEGLGTAFLAFFVFALTDPGNCLRPGAHLAPVFIGLAVAILISVLAPITQAGLNPARDLGPRLVAYAAGWGCVAIPGPRGGFLTVYVLAPCVGAILGASAYRALRGNVLGERTAATNEDRADV